MKIGRTKGLLGLAALFLLGSQALSQNRVFATYFPTWLMGDAVQWSIDQPYRIPIDTVAKNFGQITHIMIFSGTLMMDDTRAPYLTTCGEWIAGGGSPNDSIDYFFNGIGNPRGGPGDWVGNDVATLITKAHAAGVKVMADIDAIEANLGWNYVVQDSARSQVFWNVCRRWLIDHDFDGIDFNIETGHNQSDADAGYIQRFFRIGHNTIPDSMEITIVPNWADGDYYGWGYTEDYIDYVFPQIQCNGNGWDPTCSSDATWGLSVIDAADPHDPPESDLKGVLWKLYNTESGWLGNGFDTSQVVPLIATWPRIIKGVSAIFDCFTYNYGSTNFDVADTSAGYLLANDGNAVRTWNTTYEFAYIHSSNSTVSLDYEWWTLNIGDEYYIAYLDEQTLDSLFAWGESIGLPGWCFYDMGSDAHANWTSNHLPLHNHLSTLIAAAEGEEPPPPAPFQRVLTRTRP